MLEQQESNEFNYLKYWEEERIKAFWKKAKEEYPERVKQDLQDFDFSFREGIRGNNVVVKILVNGEGEFSLFPKPEKHQF